MTDPPAKPTGEAHTLRQLPANSLLTEAQAGPGPLYCGLLLFKRSCKWVPTSINIPGLTHCLTFQNGPKSNYFTVNSGGRKVSGGPGCLPAVASSAWEQGCGCPNELGPSCPGRTATSQVWVARSGFGDSKNGNGPAVPRTWAFVDAHVRQLMSVRISDKKDRGYDRCFKNPSPELCFT